MKRIGAVLAIVGGLAVNAAAGYGTSARQLYDQPPYEARGSGSPFSTPLRS